MHFIKVLALFSALALISAAGTTRVESVKYLASIQGMLGNQLAGYVKK